MKLFTKAKPKITAPVDAPTAADPVAPKARVAPIDPNAPTLTDEGVPYQALDTATIVNLADPDADLMDARRRELHVHGQPYHHVSDDALGQWVYRHDQ